MTIDYSQLDSPPLGVSLYLEMLKNVKCDYYIFYFQLKIARIALGQHQTEDLKVTCLIHVHCT